MASPHAHPVLSGGLTRPGAPRTIRVTRYAAPKGTHNILSPSPAGDGRPTRPWPDDVSKWHWLEGVFRDLCALYGYEAASPILSCA
jgi:hypothetical protein